MFRFLVMHHFHLSPNPSPEERGTIAPLPPGEGPGERSRAQRAKPFNQLLLLLFLILPLLLPAQRRDKTERAQREFAVGDYGGTIRTLQSAGKVTDEEALLLLAVAQFHENRLLEAEENLLKMMAERDDIPLVWFYLGRIYHAQHRFDRAAVEYKRYLRTLSPGRREFRTVTDLLHNIDNGFKHSFAAEDYLVENAGPAINSDADEFGPIPSPTGTANLYFNLLREDIATGKRQTDIVVSRNQDGTWPPPASLNSLLNTNRHEQLVDISPDGQKLFYYRGENPTDGSFFVDTFGNNANDLVTLTLDVPIDPGNGDATPYFGSNDGIYFASNRPGGFGGLDLYRIAYRPDGSLGPAENLGPNVNSPYDEITPFVARDGRTLYFSTNDPAYYLGGFDIVRSFRARDEQLRFVRPENVGMPLNSAGDDTHFRLAPDTVTAFFASDRKDGFGRRDLYQAYFVEPRPEMLNY